MPLRTLAVAAVVSAALGLAAPALANAPAPWAFCRGAKLGDPCDSHYYPRGLCMPQPDANCPDGGPCLYCEAGLDKSFSYDVTPAAASLAGLAGLIGLTIVLRKKRA